MGTSEGQSSSSSIPAEGLEGLDTRSGRTETKARFLRDSAMWRNQQKFLFETEANTYRPFARGRVKRPRWEACPALNSHLQALAESRGVPP